MLKLTHTQVSNDFIDTWLAVVSGSAAKCFIAVCRKTIGWHKETDFISISQMQEITGLSNRVVIKAVNELEEHNLIAKDRTQSMNKYSINYSQSDEKSHPRVTKGHSQSDEKSHTKETHINKLNKETHNKSEANEVIDYFVSVTGRKVRKTDSNYRLILPRFKEGYTVEDMKHIIDGKYKQWKCDEKMKQYIRPSTLFAASHMDAYINDYEETKKDSIGSVSAENQKPRFSFTEGCNEE